MTFIRQKFERVRDGLAIYQQRLSHLLLLGLLGSLGGLTGDLNLVDRLDDTDGDGLAHIADSETTEGGVLLEALDNHGLGGDENGDDGITLLDHLGVLLEDLTVTLVDLLLELGELAGDVGGVAVENGRVTGVDLTGVVEDDDLSGEILGTLGGIVLGVTADVTTADLLDGDVLDVETDVVTGSGLGDLLVVHLDGLDLSGEARGGEGHDLAGLDDTGLDATDGHSANTANLVDILEGDTEGLVGGTDGLLNGIKGTKEGGALVPGHVGGRLKHVVTSPARDGNEGDALGLVTNALKELGHSVLDLLVAGLGVLDRLGVHLVDGNDHLLDTKGEGEEGVLTGLTVLVNTGLELTLTGGDDEDSDISLRGTSDHVLDEITVTGGIDDGELILVSGELPESNIDGDTTLTLGLQLVKDPSVLEGTLTELGGLLLELLDDSLVDTTALVDEVSSGGGLTGIDVADHNNVDVLLLLGHGECVLVCCV